MVLSKRLFKSLLLVIAFEEKCLQKAVRGLRNFKQIETCFINLLHLSRKLMHLFHAYLLQSHQTRKELSKFKTASIFFQRTFTCSK